MRKNAFTLAEVLITLGIIGIVATLTMPNLIANYKEMVLKQQFKKSYSALSQSINRVIADREGAVPACYYVLSGEGSLTNNTFSAECRMITDLIVKKSNVIKICNNHAFDKGCIPKYKGFDTMATEQNPELSPEDAIYIVRGQSGFYQSAILNDNPAYVFADGSIIISYASEFPKIFAIDINGKKGPNKWGYDLFSFWGASNEKVGYLLIPSTYLVEKGGKRTKQMVEDISK